MKRGSLEPLETESPRGSTARSSSKIEFCQVDPDVGVDGEEPSVKKKIGWMVIRGRIW